MSERIPLDVGGYALVDLRAEDVATCEIAGDTLQFEAAVSVHRADGGLLRVDRICGVRDPARVLRRLRRQFRIKA